MTQISRTLTISKLIEAVGAKLDLTVTDTSTPNREQTIRWLNDGALILATLLPVHRLAGLQDSQDFSDVGQSTDIDNNSILRIATVKKYGVECTILEQRELAYIATRMPLLHTVRSPACAVTGRSGSVRLEFFPTFPGEVSIVYIKRPSEYKEDGDLPWSPDDYSIPVELESYLIDYAVIQGKIQDEEPEQANMLMQNWYQLVGIQTKVDVIGVD